MSLTAPDDYVSTPRTRNRSRAVAYLMCAPLVLFAAAIFIVPIVRMAVTTLVLDGSGAGTGFSIEPFTRIFVDQYARQIVYRTLIVAALTTLLALVLAYPLTLWMRQLSPRWRGLLAIVMLSPLLMSVVVRTLGWVVVLGPQGFVSDLSQALGFGRWTIMYTELAQIIGLTHVFLGFMVLALLTSVLKIPDSVIAAGYNLGANAWQVFWHIVWPMTRPGVIAGVAIVFPLTAGAYVTPALLGGSRNPTMGTEVYEQAIVLLNFDRGAALSLVLFLFICLAAGGLALASRTGRRASDS